MSSFYTNAISTNSGLNWEKLRIFLAYSRNNLALSISIWYYGAYSMMCAVIYYYIAQLGSLDTLEGDLYHDSAVREASGFEDFTPSKTTLGLFMQRLGAGAVKELFDELVKSSCKKRAW